MKVDRLVSIIIILLDRERVGAQELADMFEVSKRTIYRDIDAISMAGIPVRTVSGVGGGFEIMEKYKLDRKVFSAADLSTILTGLSGISNMVRDEELVSALAKVRSFIPDESARDIEVKASQIYIDLSPWMGNGSIQPNLQIVKAALQESRLLSFEYADHSGNKTERIAEPYQMVLKNGHWYWQGYCRTREDFRLFKLSRTSNLKMLEERFTPREHERPNLSFSEAPEAAQGEIKIRIHRSVMDRVLDYCTLEHLLPDGEEHYFVDFPFIDNDYYYGFLLSLGDRCECLEPECVRTELRRRIESIAALYG